MGRNPDGPRSLSTVYLLSCCFLPLSLFVLSMFFLAGCPAPLTLPSASPSLSVQLVSFPLRPLSFFFLLSDVVFSVPTVAYSYPDPSRAWFLFIYSLYFPLSAVNILPVFVLKLLRLKTPDELLIGRSQEADFFSGLTGTEESWCALLGHQSQTVKRQK